MHLLLFKFYLLHSVHLRLIQKRPVMVIIPVATVDGSVSPDVAVCVLSFVLFFFFWCYLFFSPNLSSTGIKWWYSISPKCRKLQGASLNFMKVHSDLIQLCRVKLARKLMWNRYFFEIFEHYIWFVYFEILVRNMQIENMPQQSAHFCWSNNHKLESFKSLFRKVDKCILHAIGIWKMNVFLLDFCF